MGKWIDYIKEHLERVVEELADRFLKAPVPVPVPVDHRHPERAIPRK